MITLLPVSCRMRAAFCFPAFFPAIFMKKEFLFPQIYGILSVKGNGTAAKHRCAFQYT
ncbi:MAG: hypothetical protein IJ412_00235 [Oscillospiraceae bacterium]|nr:hypothetical protein [Oscillospiraceae bacterium]